MPHAIKVDPVALREKTSPTPANMGSQQRGQVGEVRVEDILREHFGVVRNVSGAAHSADTTVFLDNRKIAVEVKNYTSVVPTSQVAKFREDLTALHAHAAVFVSLRSGIACMDRVTVTQERSGTRSIPVVYIATASPEVVRMSVDMVWQLARAFETARHAAHEIGIGHVNTLASCAEDFSKTRADIVNQIITLHGNMIKATTNLALNEHTLRRTVDSMLEHYPAHDTVQCLQNAKWDHEQRACVQEIARMVDRDHDVAWCVGNKKCTHVSGVSISTGTTPCLMVPRARVSTEQLAHLFAEHGKKITVTDTVCVEIAPATMQAVREIVLAVV